MAESISNSLNLPSHSSGLSRTSRVSGLSVETYFQNRLGPVALNYCPDLFHEGNSVHTASRPIFVVSMMDFPFFFGQSSQQRYSGSAFYSSSPWGFHQEFLFGVFRIARRAALRQVPVFSTKADGGSSGEVPSSPDSVVASNVSVPFFESR